MLVFFAFGEIEEANAGCHIFPAGPDIIYVKILQSLLREAAAALPDFMSLILSWFLLSYY
jgi:hypothetical protein